MDAAAAIELPPGTKISFYEVLPAATGEQGAVVRTCIGYGGFGALYRVSRGSKILALKLAHQPLSAYSPEERQWVEERGDREIAALKSLRHSNIVRVHAFDRWPNEDGRPFIVMDFVDGDRLDVWRAKQNPSVRRICQVLAVIARALHAAHEQRIYHRDLKCSNVLVRSADGQPVIVDWGIAKPPFSYAITRVNATMGTATHFAPEYCEWALAPDDTRFETTPATELHAIGYMFYQLLTGRGPFPTAATEIEVMRTIIAVDRAHGLKSPSELNAVVPKELDLVVMRLLEKEPQRRYQSGAELAGALDELLGTASSSWDDPLPVPALTSSQSVTIADRGELQDRPFDLSKDEPSPSPTVPSPVPISLPSLERPAFISIESRSPAASVTAPLTPPLPDALKAAAEKVRWAREQRGLRMPHAIAVGAIVLLSGVLALAVLGTRTRRHPVNLLARIQEQEQRTHAIPVAPAESAPEASILPPAPARPPGVSTDAQPSAETGSNSSPRGIPPSHPAARISSPAGTNKTGDDGDEPAWLQPVRKTIVPTPNSSFGVPTGAHIRARLLTNLDSRTVAVGPVEAKLVRPYVLDGRSILPAGTVLIGSAATAGSRFTIRFGLLRLPDNHESPFDGLAYDVLERKPGLAPTRRMDGPPSKADGVGTRVAKDAANTLLTAASIGSLGTTLATGAGRTFVNDQPQDSSAGTSDGTVILLDAPTDLDVFVTRAL